MTPTHAVADAHEARLRRAWMQAWAVARVGLVENPRVREAIQFRSTLLVMAALPWQDTVARLLTAMGATTRRIVVASAKATPLRVRKAAPVTVRFQFNAEHPGVRQVADQLTLDLIQGVSEESKRAIRELLAQLFSGGSETVDSIARQLRQHLGLTRTQSMALLRRRDELLRQALDPRSPMTLERAEALVDDYATRAQAQRAETIARTEGMRLANAGQQVLWRQAQSEGVLPVGQQRQWLVTPDERLCPICAPIPGNGPVGLHEYFTTGEGTQVFAPPVHPNCRCTTSLVVDFGD